MTKFEPLKRRVTPSTFERPAEDQTIALQGCARGKAALGGHVKLATYRQADSGERLGVIDNDEVVDVSSLNSRLPTQQPDVRCAFHERPANSG